VLTTTLLPGLLDTAARNVGRGQSSVAIYETAPVFVPTPERLKAPILGVDWRPDDADLAKLMAAVPRQPLTLAVVLVGDRDASGWWGAGRPVSWADAVQVVREVARVLHVEVEVVQATRAPWHPGRCAELRVDGVELGHAGELHPAVCAAYGLPARTSAVEVDLGLLIDQAPLVVQPAPFSTYPVAKEDVAFELDADVPAESVVRVIREAAGELLESVRVFDLYTGAPIPAGRKSLAFALRFRAPDRTLTEPETAEARDRAVAAVVSEFGAVHRA
jgi:phenylalanyl-tRNA synthetase beta chain